MFGLLFQVVDFLVKAVVAYEQTPQGQKELQDVLAAFEEAQTPDAVAQRVEVRQQPTRPNK